MWNISCFHKGLNHWLSKSSQTFAQENVSEANKEKKKVRWKRPMYLNPALSLAEGVCTADTGLLAPLHLLSSQRAEGSDGGATHFVKLVN